MHFILKYENFNGLFPHQILYLSLLTLKGYWLIYWFILTRGDAFTYIHTQMYTYSENSLFIVHGILSHVKFP